MIDYFCILTSGGITLYSRSYDTTIKGTPIDNLITKMILEHRTGEDIFKDGNYALMWSLNNELGLTFIAIYNKVLIQIADFARALLDRTNKKFSRLYRDITADSESLVPPSVFQQKFDPIYEEIFKYCDESSKPQNVLATPESLDSSTSPVSSTSPQPTKRQPRAPRPCK